MSEYQYYEFYSIDKELTRQERAEIDSFSSRSSTTSRGAVFSYNYGDFKYDVESVLLKYFDFFLYMANWGDRRIMFKFPIEIVNYEKMQQYICSIDAGYSDNGIRIFKKSGFVIADISLTDEDIAYWIEDEGIISTDLIGLRQDIIEGDYRALFILWLHSKSLELAYDEVDDTSEISKEMIPPNLGNLNLKLERLIDLFNVDIDWIVGASKYSSQSKSEKIDFLEMVENLPEKIKDDYLVRMMKGEVNLKIKLKKELEEIFGVSIQRKQGKVSLEEFLKSAKEAKANRIALDKAEAEKNRIRKLNNLEKNKEKILQEIDSLIERGTGKSYEDALYIILDIKELAIHKNEVEEFKKWIETVKHTARKKPAMLKRIQKV